MDYLNFLPQSPSTWISAILLKYAFLVFKHHCLLPGRAGGRGCGGQRVVVGRVNAEIDGSILLPGPRRPLSLDQRRYTVTHILGGIECLGIESRRVSTRVCARLRLRQCLETMEACACLCATYLCLRCAPPHPPTLL